MASLQILQKQADIPLLPYLTKYQWIMERQFVGDVKFKASLKICQIQQIEKMPKYIENYTLFEQVGSGSYGKVFRAVNSQDQKEYAVKVVPITKFRENKKLEECTVKEINILSNIEVNRHIIRYFDMLKTTNNFYFIYEYCNGGTLDSVIAKQDKKHLSETRSLQIFGQLLQAFKVLNKYNIMHRDLKPDNIFFHDDIVKLGDFGFCKDLASAEDITSTMLGSPIYMAPEVLRGQVYSNKADIWSLGVVLYEMIFGQCPFASNSIAKLIEVLGTQQLNFPAEISPFVATLLRKMLTKDATQRIGWMELFMLKINEGGNIAKNEKQISSLEENAQSSEETSKTPQFLRLSQPSRSRESEFGSQPNIHNSSPGSAYGRQPTSGGWKKKGTTKQTSEVSTYGADSKHEILSTQHKRVLEGVKLVIDLISSKISNHVVFSALVMRQAIKVLTEQQDSCRNPEIRKLLQSELQDMRKQLDAISRKVYSELRGTEDWKNYLRGKFVDEEISLGMWLRMVYYLDGKACPALSMNSRAMSDSIKNILY